MRKPLMLSFGLLCLFFLAVGCGKNCSLKGKVVFSDDQTPLESGTVCLVSDQGIARGSIDKNGYYVVGSVGARDGLPPGNYRIYLTDTALIEENPGGLPRITPRIDQKYAKPETSGLTVEVKSSTTYNIQVDRFDTSKR